MATVKYRTKRGFADPSGPDFECKYASLLFLRGINRTSKFFLATNMEGVGKFDDIVFIYREDKRTKACFLQLKHKLSANHQVQRASLLDTAGEFSLPLLCESYHKVLRRLPQLNNNLGIDLAAENVSVAMFTNAKIQGVRGHGLREYLLNAGGRVFAFTEASDPDIYKHMDNLAAYKVFLEQLEELLRSGDENSDITMYLKSFAQDFPGTVFGRKAERMMMMRNFEDKVREQISEYKILENIHNYMEFLQHFKMFHKQQCEANMTPLILEEFNIASCMPYNEKSLAFLQFVNSMKTWKNQKDDFKPFLTKKAVLWKETLTFSLSERVLHDLGQFGVKFQDVALVPITRAISRNYVVNVLSDSSDCALTMLKVHAALAQVGARHVLLRGGALEARRSQLLAVWQPPRSAVVVLWLDERPGVEEEARRLKPSQGRLVLVRPPKDASRLSDVDVEATRQGSAGSRGKGVKRKRSPVSSESSDSDPFALAAAAAAAAAAVPRRLLPTLGRSSRAHEEADGLRLGQEHVSALAAAERSAHAAVESLMAQLLGRAAAAEASVDAGGAQAEGAVASTSPATGGGGSQPGSTGSQRHRSRSRRRNSAGSHTSSGGPAAPAAGQSTAPAAGRAQPDSESDSDLDEKHERFMRRLERQRPGPARQALWDACQAQLEADAPPGEARLRDECSLRQLRRPPHLLGKPIRFQGQIVTLHELLVSDPRLGHALTGDALAHLLRADEPVVGVPPAPAPDFYVERPLLRASRASRALLAAAAAASPGVAFVFSGVSTQQLQDALPPGCRAEQLCIRAQQRAEDLKFVSISHELAEEALSYLCSLPTLHSVHWFYVDASNMNMHWVRSFGGIGFVRPFLESNVDQFSPVDLHERVVLLVGKPGLGKSTFVSSVAMKLKERDRTSWVVRVNLNSYSSFLDKEQITQKRTVDILLDAVLQSAKPNPFEEKLFKHCITESGKATVIVDGFDEVCFRHTDKALRLLGAIRNTKIQQLWVTSREFLRETLENKLSTFAFTLGGFDESSQRKFFKVYWENNIPMAPGNRLERFIHEFLKVVKISNLSRHGMQIPLETMMMAEAYQTQAEIFCRTDSLCDLAIPTCIDIMDLYRRFVVNKYDIKFRKDSVDCTRAGFDHMFRMVTDEYTQSHQLLALAFLFPAQDIAALNPSEVAERVEELVRNEHINANLEKVGIVTRVENSVPCFVHRTFAEYFAAQWLAEHAVANRAFLKQRLFVAEHRDMRFMFDRLLARDSELNRSVLFGDRRAMVSCLEGMQCPRRLDRGGRAALHLAGAYGRATLVQALVAAGADLEQRDEMFDWRPLQYAESAGAWDAAEALLVAGADSEPLGDALSKLSGPNFVATCARGGHIKLLQFAVEAGAASLAAAVTQCGRSALHLACEEGEALAVEYLLAAGQSAAAADRDGTTPLHLAAARGHTNVVRRLLGCGGEVNATDALRSSPLLVTAAEGHLLTARTLVESGADVNLPGPLDTTPLHWAAARGFEELVRYLLASHADARAADAERCTPLHEAAAGGHVGACRALLLAGARADAADADGLTPLHAAAQRGHAQVVEIVAAAAPQCVNARDERGRRPVHLAAEGAHTAAVRVLARAGANLHATDGEGLLPLHLAARSGHVDLLRFLLETGCGVNTRDSRDQTPLHHAVAAGHEEAMGFLVSANANVVASDNRGWCPVHVAVRHGHIKALNLLYEQGAFMDQEALCGTTPLHLAAEAGHQEIVRFLVECGVDVNHQDKQGRRPVHLAAARGLVDTTNYLVALGADTRRPDSQSGDRRGDPDFGGHDSLIDILNPEFDLDIDPNGDI